MLAKINLFIAWFLMLQVFFREMLTSSGTWLLHTLGMPVPLDEKFGWLVGALMLVAVMLISRKAMGELPPGTGKREGKGYRLGHRVLFTSSLLSFGVYILPLVNNMIQSEDKQIVVAMFVIDFMYMSLAVFGVGVSLIYQSAQPAVTNQKP